jgi:hypothetical protein
MPTPNPIFALVDKLEPDDDAAGVALPAVVAVEVTLEDVEVVVVDEDVDAAEVVVVDEDVDAAELEEVDVWGMVVNAAVAPLKVIALVLQFCPMQTQVFSCRSQGSRLRPPSFTVRRDLLDFSSIAYLSVGYSNSNKHLSSMKGRCKNLE